MKRIFIILLILISFSAFSQKGGTIGRGKLDSTKLDFLKNNYNWNKETFLVATFRQPKNRCHYDNYKNLSKTKKSIEKSKEAIEEKDIRIISIFSGENRAKAYADNKITYVDSGSFILNTFFEKEKSCFGLIVVNQNGSYMSLAGEYMVKDVNSFIFLLNLTD